MMKSLVFTACHGGNDGTIPAQTDELRTVSAKFIDHERFVWNSLSLLYIIQRPVALEVHGASGTASPLRGRRRER